MVNLAKNALFVVSSRMVIRSRSSSTEDDCQKSCQYQYLREDTDRSASNRQNSPAFQITRNVVDMKLNSLILTLYYLTNFSARKLENFPQATDPYQ